MRQLLYSTIGSVYFLIFIPAFAAERIDFLLLPPEAWSGQNIEASFKEPETNALIIRGRDPALVAYIGSFRADQMRKLTLSLVSPRTMKGVVLWGREGKVTGDTFHIEASDTEREYTIDLWSFPGYRGTLDSFGIGWGEYEGFRSGEPIEVKITSMVLEGDRQKAPLVSAIERFFAPDLLWPYSINALAGWFFGTWSFTLLWGLLFLGSSFAFFVLKKAYARRASFIAAAAALFLVFWISYDARQLLNLRAIAWDQWKNFVVPERYDKTYPALDDFYGFVAFVKDHTAPSDTVCFESFRDWPFDQTARYELLPRKTLFNREVSREACDVLAGYKIPGNKVRVGEDIVDGSKGTMFKEHGFIIDF